MNSAPNNRKPQDPGRIEALVVQATDQSRAPDQRLNAFGELVRRFQDMAYGCAYGILGDFHLAEDVVQEAFLVAYRELPALREPRAFPGWLRRVVVSQCARATRRKRVPATSLDALPEMASTDPQSLEELEKREMQQRILVALRSLHKNQRMVTTLFYIDGYSYKEIAEFLEVPAPTVRSRLMRARSKLKQKVLAMVDETMKAFSLRDDFADLVVRKAASQSDLRKAGKLMPYIRRLYPEHFESPARAEKEGIYLVKGKDTIQSAGYFGVERMSIGLTIIKAVRSKETPQESDGTPNTLLMSSLRALFKLARQHDIYLATAHGPQWSFPFCGFVPSFYYPVASLPCEDALSIETCAVVERADADQVTAAEQAWFCDPYAPKMHPRMISGEIYAVREGRNITGYFRANSRLERIDSEDFEAAGMNWTTISDVTVQTRSAALAVIRFGGELTEKAGRSIFCQMQSHMTPITQTILSLGGKYLLRRPCNLVSLGAQMIAIIDLVGLTRGLEGEFQIRLEHSAARNITTAFSIEMAGEIVAFIARSGKLKIVTEKHRVHRPLPRWIVTRLFVGYYSGEEVLAMGPLPSDRSDGITPDDLELDNTPLELPEPEARLFKVLFPKLWPTSWPDRDVWSWIFGEKHPECYFPAVVKPTDEQKANIAKLRFPWLER